MLKFSIIFSLLISTSVFAEKISQTTKEVVTAPIVYPESADIRCERVTGHSLSEFKNKLVETCDLSKPFSTSLTKLLNDDTYMFCCNLRK